MTNTNIAQFIGLVLLKHPETGESVMTSKQLSELTGARHDNVKRSMERLAKTRTIVLTPLKEVNHLHQTVEILLVNERDSHIVAAQNSPTMIAKLVDFWIAKRGQGIPQTYDEALEHILSTRKELRAANDAVALAAPKIAIIDQIDADNSDLLTMTVVAKMIPGCIRKELFLLLQIKGWIFWRKQTFLHSETDKPKEFQYWESYSTVRDSLVMQNVALEFGYTKPQLYVTAKGRLNIEKLWRSEQEKVVSFS